MSSPVSYTHLINWVLLQVGEGHSASLYLVPGSHYESLTALLEIDLQLLSFCEPKDTMVVVLSKASLGW